MSYYWFNKQKIIEKKLKKIMTIKKIKEIIS